MLMSTHLIYDMLQPAVVYDMLQPAVVYDILQPAVGLFMLISTHL